MIRAPWDYHEEYFKQAGEMVNPWGGVEAILSRPVSHLYNVPSAHAPMLESKEVANIYPGVVERWSRKTGQFDK